MEYNLELLKGMR